VRPRRRRARSLWPRTPRRCWRRIGLFSPLGCMRISLRRRWSGGWIGGRCLRMRRRGVGFEFSWLLWFLVCICFGREWEYRRRMRYVCDMTTFVSLDSWAELPVHIKMFYSHVLSEPRFYRNATYVDNLPMSLDRNLHIYASPPRLFASAPYISSHSPHFSGNGLSL